MTATLTAAGVKDHCLHCVNMQYSNSEVNVFGDMRPELRFRRADHSCAACAVRCCRGRSDWELKARGEAIWRWSGQVREISNKDPLRALRLKSSMAYATLLYGDIFLLGLRVLGKSIKDTGNTKAMVALVSMELTQDAMNLLEAD